MKITANKKVSLIYELVVDGQVADKCTEERPLTFVFGTGMLLPRFEENILNLAPGDSFAFTLTPEEGYGVYDPSLVIDFPKSAFVDNNGNPMTEIMFVGSQIPLQTATGQIVPGVITEIQDEVVKIDVNHQMAGKTLNFSGKIVEVVEATEEDLAPKHGCGGCKGHCSEEGGCEGGCGGDSECSEGGCGQCKCDKE